MTSYRKQSMSSALMPDHLKKRHAEADKPTKQNCIHKRPSDKKYPFYVKLRIGKERLYIGKYTSEKHAKEEADKAMLVLHGDKARDALNFPDKKYDLAQMSDQIRRIRNQKLSERQSQKEGL